MADQALEQANQHLEDQMKEVKIEKLKLVEEKNNLEIRLSEFMLK